MQLMPSAFHCDWILDKCGAGAGSKLRTFAAVEELTVASWKGRTTQLR